MSTSLLSFFTGAGFLDLGFMQQSFDIVWHNENNKTYIQAFQYGISSMGYNGDAAKIQNKLSINDIGSKQIINEAFGKNIPTVFGIIGGPPCPDFSVGGKNKGYLGEHGILSETYINRILEIKPTFFLYENVPGLIKTTKHRNFLLYLLNKLAPNYMLDLNLLNALDFGVPQDRERIFIIGVDKNYFKNTNNSIGLNVTSQNNHMLIYEIENNWKNINTISCHWFPWPKYERNAKKGYPWPKGSVPLDQEPALPLDCPKELMVGTYICDVNRFELPNSDELFQPKSDKFNSIKEGDVSKKSFKKLHRYRYSPSAAYGNNEVHLHPTENRRLTVREALMIQTVPNDYILPSDISLTHKFKIIGNGVPVKLASAIAESLKKFIELYIR